MMKKLLRFLTMAVCIMVMLFANVSLHAEAADETTGTFGKRDSIVWVYDADTKTLTLTGDGELETVSWGSNDRIGRFCSDVEHIKVVDCKLSSCNYMFAQLSKLKSITFENFDTSQTTDMANMFKGCSSLESVNVSDFNTSQVTKMSSMFVGCKSLENINVSGFNTAQVTNMESMFSNCSSLESVNVSGFDTTKVTDMSYMFKGCSSLESLAVSGFNTAQVTDMTCMFDDCSSLKSLDVSNFNTGKVTDMYGMFDKCSSLTALDMSNFMLANLEDWSYMLRGCTSLEFLKTPKETSNSFIVKLDAPLINWRGNERTSINSMDCGKILYAPKFYPLIDFVDRMYSVALGRWAEEAGVNFYTERLIFGDSNGACLAESFLCSPEFLNIGDDDDEYITVLYRTFFDREPAAEEVNYWVDKLASGESRAFVLSGFVNSVEFDNLCAQYGISRGFMREDGKPLNPGIGRFAERLYTVVLERAGEKEGIEYWSLNMANGTCTPKDAAKSFFLSQEYINKNTSDAQYITTLYRTFMDREPEAGGVEYWQNVLNNGATREQILEGFADSAEFKGIMASFGL